MARPLLPGEVSTQAGVSLSLGWSREGGPVSPKVRTPGQPHTTQVTHLYHQAQI